LIFITFLLRPSALSSFSHCLANDRGLCTYQNTLGAEIWEKPFCANRGLEVLKKHETASHALE
jgi:hypothetical protein